MHLQKLPKPIAKVMTLGFGSKFYRQHGEHMVCGCVNVCSVAQLCATLRSPVHCNLPGSSVHEISQARTLEWVAISYTRGSSQFRNPTQVSCISALAGRFFTTVSPGKPRHSTDREHDRNGGGHRDGTEDEDRRRQRSIKLIC